MPFELCKPGLESLINTCMTFLLNLAAYFVSYPTDLVFDTYLVYLFIIISVKTVDLHLLLILRKLNQNASECCSVQLGILHPCFVL